MLQSNVTFANSNLCDINSFHLLFELTKVLQPLYMEWLRELHDMKQYRPSPESFRGIKSVIDCVQKHSVLDAASSPLMNLCSTF